MVVGMRSISLVVLAVLTVSACNSAGGGGADAGPPQLSCSGLLDCAAMCAAGDAACPAACRERTSPQGLALVDALAACAKDCADSACIQMTCPSQAAACLGDSGGTGGGAGGGSGGGTGGALDPSQSYDRDLVAVSFRATVKITNITTTDAFCNAGPATVDGTFNIAPAAVNQKVGTLRWEPTSPAGRRGSFFAEVDCASMSQISAFTSASSSKTVTCPAAGETFPMQNYRLNGDFDTLTGNITVIAPMPIDPITGSNIACGGLSSCWVSYGFDNTSGVHRSTPFSVADAFSGAEFEVPFSGTAMSASDAAKTRAGAFTWSGTMRLKSVPR